jgi:hypothetical protein
MDQREYIISIVLEKILCTYIYMISLEMYGIVKKLFHYLFFSMQHDNHQIYKKINFRADISWPYEPSFFYQTQT